MLTYVVSDLFQSPAQVLVNTVNTVGVMGKGLAKEFKTIYPEMFKRYQQLCEQQRFDVGQLWLYQTPHKWVLNFPTKKHWRSPSKPEYIEAGLQKFVDQYANRGITSISFPLLGCGNGELDWETQVRPLMERYLKELPIDIYIHLYRKDPYAPEHREADAIHKWLRSEPESLPFGEVWEELRDLLIADPLLHPPGGLKPVQATPQDTDEIALVLDRGDGLMYALWREQLVELWQQLRATGFSHPHSMPAGLDELAPYVVALFGRLPYVKPTIMFNRYQSTESAQAPVGLQLTPWLNGPTPHPHAPHVEARPQ